MKTMRAKVYISLSIILLGIISAIFAPAQSALASGENYSWATSGTNHIQGFGGVFEKGPGNGETFTHHWTSEENEGGGDVTHTYTEARTEATAPLLFSAHEEGGIMYYEAAQAWGFVGDSTGAADKFAVACGFTFRVTLSKLDQEGTPGSDGSPNLYSVGTIAVQSDDDAAKGGLLDPFNDSGFDDWAWVCDGIAKEYGGRLTRNITVDGAAPAAAKTTDSEPPGDDDDTAAESTTAICYQNNGTLGWVMCPMQSWMMDLVTGLDRALVNMVKVDTPELFYGTDGGITELPEASLLEDPTGLVEWITASEDDYRQSSTAFHTAWAAFRTLAFALLLIFGLIMVVSQVMGLELFDAYSIRKMLPRLVIAAIIIPLLWPIMSFVFNMANDSAEAVQSILLAPFNDMSVAFGDGELTMRVFASGAAFVTILTVLIGLATVPFIGGAVGGVVLTSVIGALISVLSAFFVLMARDIVVDLLVILSPVAVVCAIFQPFQKAFGMWRQYLVTILLSIPAIMAVLTASKIAAGIASITNQGFGPVLGAIFIVVGYVMFWPVFKQLDKVSGQIDGMASKATGGIQKWLSNTRSKAYGEALGRVKRGQFDRSGVSGFIGRGVRAVSKVPDLTSFRHIGAQMRLHEGTDIAGAIKELKEQHPELAETLNDDVLHKIAADSPVGDREHIRRQLMSRMYKMETGADGKKYFVDKDGKRTDDESKMVRSTTGKYAVKNASLSDPDARRQMEADTEAVLGLHHLLGDRSAAVLATTLPSTGSMDGEGPGETMRRIFDASNGDTRLAAALWQAAKKSAMEAGRTDFGARQGAFLEAYDRYAEAQKEVVRDENGDVVELTPEERRLRSEAAAAEIIEDAAFEQQGAQAAVQGRHEVAQAYSRHLTRNRKRSTAKLKKAQKAYDRAQEEWEEVLQSGETAPDVTDADLSYYDVVEVKDPITNKTRVEARIKGTGQVDHEVTKGVKKRRFTEAQQLVGAAEEEVMHTVADTQAAVDSVTYAAPEKGRHIAGTSGAGEGLGGTIDLYHPENAPLRESLEQRYKGVREATVKAQQQAWDKAYDGLLTQPNLRDGAAGAAQSELKQLASLGVRTPDQQQRLEYLTEGLLGRRPELGKTRKAEYAELSAIPPASRTPDQQQRFEYLERVGPKDVYDLPSEFTEGLTERTLADKVISEGLDVNDTVSLRRRQYGLEQERRARFGGNMPTAGLPT